MGKSMSGKTSMRSIIFANYLARETARLGPTFGIENAEVVFLGNLSLTLWDCGGQEDFFQQYLDTQRVHIFKNVEVLIYVFDVSVADRKEDTDNFKECLDAIRENSENAKIFCLIHKMDVVSKEDKTRVLAERTRELKDMAGSLNLRCFGTSIWDETLYKAWSSIVYSLVPNVDRLESHLNKFCKLVMADEVVLFEKATFLVISHATHKEHSDAHRYEKISNIVKQFKLSCSKAAPQPGFQAMEVRNRNFNSVIELFTENTYIMVIITEPQMQSAAVQMSIQGARPHFEKLVQQSVGR